MTKTIKIALEKIILFTSGGGIKEGLSFNFKYVNIAKNAESILYQFRNQGFFLISSSLAITSSSSYHSCPNFLIRASLVNL